MSPRDPDDLYQQHAREGSPANLDARILQAAREQAQANAAQTNTPAPRQRAHWSQRWAVPVSLAAVLTLSLLVVLDTRQQATDLLNPIDPLAINQDAQVVPESLQDASELAEAAGVSEPALSKQAKAGKRAQELSINTYSGAPASGREESAPTQALSPQRNVMAVEKETRAKAEQLQSRQAEVARSLPAPSVFSPPVESAPVHAEAEAEAPAVVRSDKLTEHKSVTVEQQKSAAAYDATGAATSPSGTGDRARQQAAEQTRTPEQWLEAIRDLQKAGEHKKAAAELAAFKEEFPDYPDDKIKAILNSDHHKSE